MTYPQPPSLRLPRRLPALLALAVVLFLAADSAVRLAVELLWYSELGYRAVLTTRWTNQILFGLAGFAVAFGVLAANALLALGRGPAVRLSVRGELRIVDLTRQSRRVAVIAAALVALVFASSLAGRWLDLRLATTGVSYGLREPILGRDVGTYLFLLPALRLLLGWFAGLLVLTLAVVLVLDALGGAMPTGRAVRPASLRHWGILGAVLLLLVAAHFALAQFQVLYSPRGVVHGAGHADVAARVPGARILVVASLAAAAAVAVGAFRARPRWMLGPPAAVLVLHLLANGLWPTAMQKLIVEPNELAKEKPYIETAVRLTREAYDLDGIEPRPFVTDRKLDAGVVAAQRDLLDNVRLWDWRPLLATYGQIQEIRLYYNFADVDIDRYILDGRLRQVMLSARELAYDQIPEGARTWVNLHLKYTHGYGLCMSPVNRVTSEGLPELLVRDIPPASTGELPVRRPEIYFGEQTSTFALVGTSTDEFDYPLGETNQMTRYAGKGGIGVGGLGRRLLFAWYLGSREMLLTRYLSPESRLLLRRSLRDRVPRLAPFLRYDHDPYLVLDDGRLFWIQDAYTTSARFPGSRPVGRLNYIRNAVKVVVDAFDGTVTFYAAQPDEPMLRAYAAVFPGLFRPLETMPAGLRDHLRYPEDLFRVQAEIYATYHMTDAQVFYNREDLWSLPVQSAGGREETVEPYYTMVRLAGSTRAEMVLMLPFTPARKDNMIAWLVARCDGEHLGERQVYLFPKQELVYGPRQIEARIDQDPSISQLLTLWSQRGSNVIRGNLLVLPIAQTLLYVEPLYLQAEKGALPQLKRVILAHADRIEMGPDLESTLARLLGAQLDVTAGERPLFLGPAPGAGAASGGADSERARAGSAGGSAAERGMALLRAAEAALQRGDWVEHGRAMQELRSFLEAQAAPPPKPAP